MTSAKTVIGGGGSGAGIEVSTTRIAKVSSTSEEGSTVMGGSSESEPFVPSGLRHVNDVRSNSAGQYTSLQTQAKGSQICAGKN